jgi:hypothetical protein
MVTTDGREMPELPPDVLQIVFQELAGDYEALVNVSLTCSAWQSLAQPSVYREVDISSHNNGRQPQLECEMRPLVYADYDGEFRPQNLVSRQRTFLRRMVDQPQLAKYVKSFTWTLIWLDFDEQDLTEIDLQTWDVFSNLTNVTYLDLASLHRHEDDEYVRQNPAVLFPKVRDLRLLGWMHRGLVRAIVTSLDSSKIQSLRLDYLEDEGAFPNGESLGEDTATRLAHHARRKDNAQRPSPKTTDGSYIYDDHLILRQETGKAFIFPGPMWLPLYLLSAHAMDSLTHLQIKVPPFSFYTDLRSYQTLFRQTANFTAKVKGTLKSLVIVFGESWSLYAAPVSYGCANGDDYRSRYRPWCTKMAKLFLEQMLAVLNGNAFPRLENMRFEGFSILVRLPERAGPHEVAEADLTGVFQSIADCRFADGIFTDISSVQRRESYHGHDRLTDGECRRFEHMLADS